MSITNRRPKTVRPVAESLETRALLTGGAGSTFALVPGEISTAGGTQTVTVHVDPGHFTMPRKSMTLGVDIAASSGSTVHPKIISVTPVAAVSAAGANGHKPAATSGGMVHIKRVKNNTALLADLRSPTGKAMDYNVTVKAQDNTAGKYLLGFYLPGDADGNGTVTQDDLNTITKNIGAISGDKQYNFDNDTNRDGRIGLDDLRLAQKNLGVKTTITPVVNANLDPASDTGDADRITNAKVAHFTGTGTVGATISYAEAANKSPEVKTTVGADGNYSINVPLALGSNTFKVKSVDAFGQVISGQITPLTYTTSPAPATKASSGK